MATKKPLTPEKAIRMKCLECCCYAPIEVENCNLTDCPLFDFRMIGAKQSDKKDSDGKLVVETNSNSLVCENASISVNTIKPVETPVKKQSKKKSVKAKEPDEVIESISKVDTGTGTICGEPVIPAETVKPIEVTITKENVVMPAEEAEKHTITDVKKKPELDDIDLDLDIDDEPVEIELTAETIEQHNEENLVPDVTMPDIDIEETAPKKKQRKNKNSDKLTMTPEEAEKHSVISKKTEKIQPEKKVEEKSEEHNDFLDIDADELFEDFGI